MKTNNGITCVIPKSDFYHQLEDTKQQVRNEIIEFVLAKTPTGGKEKSEETRVFEELKKVVPVEKQELLFDLESAFNSRESVDVENIIFFLLENAEEINRTLTSY